MRGALRLGVVVLAIGIGGCTLEQRNVVAVGLCERTAGCTVTKNLSDNGPPQVSAMENRKPVSRTTEK